jgi:hypothetical protein
MLLHIVKLSDQLVELHSSKLQRPLELRSMVSNNITRSYFLIRTSLMLGKIMKKNVWIKF